jgi:hypothetical protein
MDLLLVEIVGEALGPTGHLEALGHSEPKTSEQAREAADRGVEGVLAVVALEDEIFSESVEVPSGDLLERLPDEPEESPSDVPVLFHRARASLLDLQHSLKTADDFEDGERWILAGGTPVDIGRTSRRDRANPRSDGRGHRSSFGPGGPN